MEEIEQKKTMMTRSYRVDDETASKISDLAKELGVNQNTLFEILLSSYELQQDATMVPNAAKDIEDFVSHLRSIQDAYHHIISINVQTEERIRQEFQRRLENCDKQISDLIKTKEEQQETIKRMQEEIEGLYESLIAKDQLAEEAKQKIIEKDKSLEDKKTIIDSLTARLPEQAKVDLRIKSMEEEIQRLGSEIAISESKRMESVSNAEKAIAELEMERRKAELSDSEHRKEIESVKKAHAMELDTAHRQAQADLKTAVAEARQEERDHAQEKIEKLLEKVEDLQTKIDAQKDNTILKMKESERFRR